MSVRRMWEGGATAALVVLAMGLGGCRSLPKSGPEGLGAPVKGSTVTFLYQQGREGQLEPCGCHTTPYGGIDREKNALSALRASNPEAVFVDAGNAFFPTEARVPVDLYRERGKVLARMLGEMDLKVMGVGPADLNLGVESLKEYAKIGSFGLVSSNIEKGGKPVFETFQILTVNGVKVAWLSVVDPALVPKASGLKAADPKKALKAALAQVADKAQVVVVASQLPSHDAARKLAAALPEVHLWIGNDPKLTLDWGDLQDKALLLDGHRFGYFIGKLRADFRFPHAGFYSQVHIDANRKALAGYESALKKLRDPKRREMLETRAAKLRQTGIFEPIPGGTPLQHELIALDAERFGASNSFTQIMKEQARIAKQKALDAGAAPGKKQ